MVSPKIVGDNALKLLLFYIGFNPARFLSHLMKIRDKQSITHPIQYCSKNHHYRQ
jgi:hypothetical protein